MSTLSGRCVVTLKKPRKLVDNFFNFNEANGGEAQLFMLKVDNLHTNYYKDWTKAGEHQFWTKLAVSDHVCHIYQNEEDFLSLLHGFASNGFEAGDCVLIIATAEHLKALNARIRAAGLQPSELIASGRYLPFDANKLLARFMVDHWPDEELFMKMVAELTSLAYKTDKPVRVFGEMVAILWAQGHGGATVQLEYLWKSVCEREEFCLFCAYPQADFTEGSGASLTNICNCHTKLVAGCANSPTELFYKNTVLKK